MKPVFLVFVLALITIAFEVCSDAAFTGAEVSHAAVPDPATWAIVHGFKRGYWSQTADTFFDGVLNNLLSYMLKAVLNGRADEIVELARSNLRR